MGLSPVPTQGSLFHSVRGVTMPELLAVLTIVGVTTAMVGPKIDFAHFSIDADMRGVGTTMMAAQREAVASQFDVIVTFDSTARTIRMHWDANNDGVENNGERIRVIGLGDGVTFGRPSSVTARSFGSAGINFALVNGRPAIIFRRNGSASESGGIYLTSMRALRPGATSPNDTRSIEFERATGRAEWYRYQDAWHRGF